MLVNTGNGLSLPTRAGSGPLVTQQLTPIGAADAYPGSIPAIQLNGHDVTTSLIGGTLGANITLRDSTLPTMQAELDSFSATLAARFSTQGLALFTNASGSGAGTDPTVAPPSGQLGFSSSIQVNPTVTATPSMVRDGTTATLLNPTGIVGFTGLISNVLNYALGVTSVAGAAPYVAAASTGLGVNGTLSAPYVQTGSLSTLATALTGSQASTIAFATTRQSSQTDIQTTLQASLTSTSGVSVDNQMANVVALQNAYESNAKVVAAVQTMFSALLAAIT